MYNIILKMVSKIFEYKNYFINNYYEVNKFCRDFSWPITYRY